MTCKYLKGIHTSSIDCILSDVPYEEMSSKCPKDRLKGIVTPHCWRFK